MQTITTTVTSDYRDAIGNNDRMVVLADSMDHAHGIAAELRAQGRAATPRFRPEFGGWNVLVSRWA